MCCLGTFCVDPRSSLLAFEFTNSGCALADLSTTLLMQPVGVMQFLQEHLKKPLQHFNQQDWMKVLTDRSSSTRGELAAFYFLEGDVFIYFLKF